MARQGDGLYHMTLSEIGKEMGLSRQAVEQIQKRALQKIRSKLEDYEDHESREVYDSTIEATMATSLSFD